VIQDGIPQGLKRHRVWSLLGTAEAVPCYKTFRLAIRQALRKEYARDSCRGHEDRSPMPAAKAAAMILAEFSSLKAAAPSSLHDQKLPD